jgi:acetyl esterase/lipase
VTPGRDKRVAVKPVISVPVEEVFDTLYVPSPEARRDRLASPAWGPNGDGIAGIAPALVITCEIDQLHDEGVAYAGKLAAAGALREHVDLMGTGHGYNLLGKDPALVEHSYELIAKHVSAATAS